MALSKITSDSITANTITSAALANTGVTAGVYGGAAAIPVITVDSVGRLTSAANVAFSGSSVKISSRSSNTILAAADNAYLINLSSTFTQTFTAAATLGNGWFCYLKNGGSGDITLDPNASETIDGLTSFVMYPGEARLVQCDGTAFTSVVLTSFRKRITSTSTFVTPPGYTQLALRMWGGGGGGGGGRGNSSGGYKGGGGAAGGGQNIATFESTPGTSTTVTIGAGGTGGAGSVGNGAASDGTSGGTTSFGTQFYAYGGWLGAAAANYSGGLGGGGGGTLSAAESNQGGKPRMAGYNGTTYQAWGTSVTDFGVGVGFGGAAPNYFSEYGGAGGATYGNAGQNSLFGAAGGGGGENDDGSGNPSNGGIGLKGGGLGYQSGYTNGASGGANGVVLSSGSGGGGGGGIAPAGNGGAGATPGGGGGGGAGSNSGVGYAGSGGAGGNGLCIIWGVV